MWLTIEAPHLRTSIDDSIATAVRVARAEFWLAAKAGQHAKETFAVAQSRNALTSGVIDVLFKSEAHIRDYKTNVSLDRSGSLQCKPVAMAVFHMRYDAEP